MEETHRIHTAAHLAQSVTVVKHIKLGAGNAWANEAIAAGDLVFGDAYISHELASDAARTGDWSEVRSIYRARTKDGGAATRLTGELKDFYTLGSECLWVTFHRGRLYWAIATPEISFDKNAEPPRRRRTSGGWISTDVSGKPLDHFTLSSAITQTRMARGTICQPQAWRKYISLIRSEPNPLIDRARIEQAQLTSTLAQLIETLDQHDFEVLAQRVAESLGWRIETGIGGVQPDIDFAATLPALGLKAYFQVKTRSTQTQLEAFVASMPAASDARIVFVTHKRGHLKAGFNPNMEIWAGEDLAQKAMNAGLMAWMLERAQ